jgi:hypothetical protein
MRRMLVIPWVVLCVCWGSGTALAIGTDLTLANHDPFDACGGITPGGTSLLDLERIPIESADYWRVMFATFAQYPAGDQGQTWRYQSGLAYSNLFTLDGELLVDWYKAFDRADDGSCQHGAEIVAYYDFGPDDPVLLSFDWISLFTETGGSGADTDRVDGDEDLDPAYYTTGDVPWTPDGYVLDPDHDLVFTDAPQDEHVEAAAWDGSVEFYTFLAGYSLPYFENNVLYQDIVLFDGFRWGYQGSCQEVIRPIPAPGAFLLVSIGACLIVRLRRRGI